MQALKYVFFAQAYSMNYGWELRNNKTLNT